MGTISSNNFETRAGSGSISISHPSLTGGQNYEVSSLDDISADFDLEEQGEASTNIYFKMGELSFSAFDRLSDGTSLFGTLDTLSATDEVTIDFSFTTNAGRGIADKYIFTKEDMEYDREARETSITGAVRVTDGLKIAISTFFTNEISASESETFSVTGTPSCIDARTFINNALPLFNSNNTSVNHSQVFGDDGTVVPNAYIVVNDSNANNTDVDELLYEMAASEGALIGSIMGYNFFVARNEQSNTPIAISEDNVLENSLKIKPGLDVYYSIEVNFEGNSTNYSTWTSNRTQTYNTEAIKTLTVTYRNNVMAWASWDSTNSEYDDVGGNTGAPGGVSAYAKSYGASKARKIELTILGIDTIKPYNALSLDSSFPSLIQNQTFRPSALTYDFNKDVVRVEAYKIS